VSVHLTEEEQLQALKRWWKDYGKTVVVAVIVAVAGYFGFTSWQQHKLEQAQATSELYNQLMRSAVPSGGMILSDSEKTTARTLAGQLKEKKSSSLYAHNAALLLARLAVEEGELDQAVTELRWVLQNKPDITTEQVTRLRLARLLIAKQDYTEVESLLANPVNAFKSDYAEVRGDLARAKGDLAAAKNAYEEALTGVDPQVQERRILLQYKLDDLATNQQESAQ
jgi:predicted negative regulator of RcsB-dependent stress response